MAYTFKKLNIFAEKNVSSFCKSYSHFFFSKTTCDLDIVLTGTVNILTTNELVKLTMLWTTGPSSYILLFSKVFTVLALFSLGAWANIVDPDQTPQKMVSNIAALLATLPTVCTFINRHLMYLFQCKMQQRKEVRCTDEVYTIIPNQTV